MHERGGVPQLDIYPAYLCSQVMQSNAPIVLLNPLVTAVSRFCSVTHMSANLLESHHPTIRTVRLNRCGHFSPGMQTAV